MIAKIRCAGLQVSDHADDDGFVSRYGKDPFVVGRPGAALDSDRADDAVGSGQLSVAIRQRALVDRTVLWRPRDTLRTRNIEQVNVGVDNRNSFGLCSEKIRSTRGGAAQEVAAIHMGIICGLK